MDNITFADIPTNLRLPGAYFSVDPSQASTAAPQIPRKVLILGQRLSAGTVAANVPYRCNSDDEAALNSGYGSMVHRMAIRARDAAPLSDIWIIGLDDDPNGVVAGRPLSVLGTATAPGVLYLYIAGQRLTIAVAKGDSAATLGPVIAAAINARTSLPVIASWSSSDGVVNVNCRWAGVTGNDIDIRCNYYQGERYAAGLSVALFGDNHLLDNCDSATGWTLGTDWSLDAGDGEFDKAAGSATSLVRAVTGLTVGQTYCLRARIAKRSNGSVVIKVGSTVLETATINRAYIMSFVATAATANISFDADTAFNGSIQAVWIDIIAPSWTRLAGGEVDPDPSDALTAIAGEWFYSILTPYTDSAFFAILDPDLADRWGPIDPRPAHVFRAKSGTHSALTTFGETRNSIHCSTLGLRGVPTPPWEVAAAWGAAVDAKAANTDPIYPFVGLAIPGMLAPSVEDRFSGLESNLLSYSGLSTYTVDRDGTCRVGLVLTEYQTNTLGVEDISLLYLNHKWGADLVRYVFRVWASGLIAQGFKLSKAKNTLNVRGVLDMDQLRALSFPVFRMLEGMGIVQDFDQYKRDVRFEISLADPTRVNAIIPPELLSPLHVIAAAVQFRL